MHERVQAGKHEISGTDPARIRASYDILKEIMEDQCDATSKWANRQFHSLCEA